MAVFWPAGWCRSCALLPACSTWTSLGAQATSPSACCGRSGRQRLTRRGAPQLPSRYRQCEVSWMILCCLFASFLVSNFVAPAIWYTEGWACGGHDGSDA